MSAPLPGLTVHDVPSFFRPQKERLVAFGYSHEVALVGIRQRCQYLMPPVKGGFLVDRQGFLYPVQALLLDHQTKIALDLVLMVDARHPSARILREAPPAGLALVPLGAALFPEPYIFRVATMGARPLFIVQHLPADLQNTFRSFRPDHILKFAHQLRALRER